jgi:endonuclease G
MLRELIWSTLFIACSPASQNVPKTTVVSDQDLVNTETPAEESKDSLKNLALPRLMPGEEQIHHFAYDLVYSEPHEQAKWVAYELTLAETNSLYERNDRFLPDPSVKTGSATDSDYAGYNYDRGHLAPAADMSWSDVAMKESFYYSNMSPQIASFNRGVWKRLESQVRTWAILDSSVYIATGPILKENLYGIGPNKVSVPTHYYKVVMEYSGNKKKGLGFVMPNAGSSLPLQTYAVSIDSVERLTGIDFFAQLPDKDEQEVESKVCLNCWSWGVVKTRASGTGKKSESVQCKGITKSGSRCKRMTLSSNGFCFQHGGN